MTTVPRAICAKCNAPFKIERQGISLAAIILSGRVYYKVMSDLHRCTGGCGAEIYTGFGDPIESFHKGFDSFPADVNVRVE